MDLLLQSATEDEPRRLFLRPDDTKKSVYWLHNAEEESSSCKDSSTKITVAAPAEAIITRENDAHEDGDRATSEEQQTFAWGGMQITSNAKAIEIYYTSPTSKEAYLTTIKGMPAKEESDMVKALCAVPGGPRAVVAVRLKFLSLHPKDCPTFCLATVKWTARIASVSQPRTNPSNSNMPHAPVTNGFQSMNPLFAAANTMQMPNPIHPTAATALNETASIPSSHVPPHLDNFISKEDVGAAMAGMTFAMRSTEERITKQIDKSTAGNAQLQKQIHMLSQQIFQQTQLIQYQSTLIHKQQETLAEHSKIIQCMQQQEKGRTIDYQKIDTQNSPGSAGKRNRDNAQPSSPNSYADATSEMPSWQFYASIDM